MPRVTAPIGVVLLVPFLVLAFVRTAAAADFRVEGETLFLDGPIVRGDAETLRGMLGANPEVKRVSLDSPGGDLATGLALGKLIRERKLETVVEGGMREAASAAAYAFMGGEIRTVKGTRGIGVHAFSTPSKEVRAMLKQRSGDELVRTINEFERSTQEATMAVVEFVITMIGDTRIVAEAVKAGADEMAWLPSDRLIALKVATRQIPLAPDEIPDPDWAYGEVVAGLALWLVPGSVGTGARVAGNADGLAPDAPLDERERATLEAMLHAESSQAALRADVERLLDQVAPPNRIRARTMLVEPVVRSIIESVRASVRKAREAEAAAGAEGGTEASTEASTERGD